MRRRAIVRLSNRYILRYVSVLAQLFDQDVVKGLVFLAICDANIGYVDQFIETSRRYADLETPAPDAIRRPIRPHKLALSLGLPRETVRRKVSALLAEGWLSESDLGAFANAQALDSDAMRWAMMVNTALVIDLFTGLAHVGVDCQPPPPAASAGPPLPHRAIARISAAYCLRSLDELRGLFDGELLTSLVFCSIVDANSAYLDEMPGPPHADLDDHVPDAVRRPISALALAARLDLPRETVRRHVRKLEAQDCCDTVKGGLIVPQRALRRETVVSATVRNASNLRLLLGMLGKIGFPAEQAQPPLLRQAGGPT